jgi:hypothetical protein
MRTKLFFALLMVFALSAPGTFAASKTEKKVATTENKMTSEEASRLTKRVEEIRDMDKTNMTVTEKRELRKELKATKENIRKDGGYIYVSAGTVILIIILVILLV